MTFAGAQFKREGGSVTNIDRAVWRVVAWSAILLLNPEDILLRVAILYNLPSLP
jgi:hypothetical protein